MPKNDDSLDLDTLEREGEHTPFPVTLDGKQYMMRGPRELTYEEAAEMGNATPEILATFVPEDQGRDEFLAKLKQLPGWKVDVLNTRYNKHFGLLPEGEADASPTS